MRTVLLVVLCTACGSSSTPNSDAALDSSPPTTGTIRIRVVGGTITAPTPVVGDSVVFTDVNGTQVVTTDAAGEASATVTGPTDVTDIHYTGVVFLAKSVLKTEPGDEIEIFPRYLDYTVRAPVTVNFTPTDPSNWICSPCGCVDPTPGQPGPIGLSIEERCVADPLPLMIVDTVHGTYATASVPYDATTGGAVTLPMPSQQSRQLSGTFTNIALPINRVVFDFWDGINDREEFLNPPPVVNSQVYGWVYNHPRFDVFFGAAIAGNPYQLTLSDVTAATEGISIDVATWLLPWLGTLTFDESSRTVHVPIAVDGADGDMFAATVFPSRPGGGGIVEWDVFQEKPEDFVLPMIPESVVDTAGMSVYEMGAFVLASESLDGYAAARRDPYALSQASVLPDLGTVRLSASPGAQLAAAKVAAYSLSGYRTNNELDAP